MRPCQVEHAIRETPILILFDQVQACIAGLAHAEHKTRSWWRRRIERDVTPNRHDRIEHGSLAIRKPAHRRRELGDRQWCGRDR